MENADSLEQRAVEHAKRGDFGAAARQLNLDLARLAPANQGAWTRLGRCNLELGLIEEATAALEEAIRLNPLNIVARSLRAEIERRRAVTRTTAPPPRRRSPPSTTRQVPARSRARSSAAAAVAAIGRAEFAALAELPPKVAAETLTGRIEPLLMALNDKAFAARVVEARHRAGHAGSWLFRRNTVQPGTRPGHVHVHQHGGDREPQMTIGLFARTHWARDSMCAGIGFDLAPADGYPIGHERSAEYFARFQRMIASDWRELLTTWMSANGGFIQAGQHPPATDLLPRTAVTWLIDLPNPSETGWIFCGRWLFADRADHAEVLSDGRRLLDWLGQTFQDLLPLWMGVYRGH